LFYVYYSCYNLSNYYENIIKNKFGLIQSAYDSIFLLKARDKNYKKNKSFIKLFKNNEAPLIDKLSKNIWQVKN
jgi:predicted O-linked N-acetylglucosamine transferase (SPINDLY family)